MQQTLKRSKVEERRLHYTDSVIDRETTMGLMAMGWVRFNGFAKKVKCQGIKITNDYSWGCG